VIQGRVASRAYGALVSAAVLAAVAWPLTRDPRRADSDGFPLSTYPMFARPRSTRMTLDYAVGITTGAPRPLRPALVGSLEPLQAAALLERAVARGPAGMRELCERIAARVAADDDLGDVTHVALVRGDHDAVDLLVRGVRGREREHVRCPVKRRLR